MTAHLHPHQGKLVVPWKRLHVQPHQHDAHAAHLMHMQLIWYSSTPSTHASISQVVPALIAVSHREPSSTHSRLSAGAKEHLHTGGILFLYGPFLVDGRPTTQSNAQFNESMKDLNPEWGLRYVLALRPRPIHEGSDPEWDLRYALALCPRPVHEEFNPRVAPAVWPCAMS